MQFQAYRKTTDKAITNTNNLSAKAGSTNVTTNKGYVGLCFWGNNEPPPVSRRGCGNAKWFLTGRGVFFLLLLRNVRLHISKEIPSQLLHPVKIIILRDCHG